MAVPQVHVWAGLARRSMRDPGCSQAPACAMHRTTCAGAAARLCPEASAAGPAGKGRGSGARACRNPRRRVVACAGPAGEGGHGGAGARGRLGRRRQRRDRLRRQRLPAGLAVQAPTAGRAAALTRRAQTCASLSRRLAVLLPQRMLLRLGRRPASFAFPTIWVVWLACRRPEVRRACILEARLQKLLARPRSLFGGVLIAHVTTCVSRGAPRHTRPLLS